MSWTRPPSSIAWELDRMIPGVWQQVLGALQYAHGRAPFTVTSWWRGVEKNRSVGGSASSQHLIGLAFDCAPGTPAVEDALRSVGFRTVRYSTHVHAQVFPAGVPAQYGLLRIAGV